MKKCMSRNITTYVKINHENMYITKIYKNVTKYYNMFFFKVMKCN